MAERWTYTWESRFHNNEYDKQYAHMYFGKYNIDNMIYIGKIMYTEAHPPIGEHVHLDAFEISYHITGNQVFYLDDKKYDIGAGDILVSFPGEIHKTGEFLEEVSTYYFFSFVCLPGDSSFLGLDKDASRFLTSSLYSIKKRQFRGSPKIRRLLDEVIETYHMDTPVRKSRIQYLFAEILYHIITLSNAKDEQISIPKEIYDTMTYIESRAHDNLTLMDLADYAGLSLDQFKHQFKKYVGVPPHRYLLSQKIKLAKDMLRYTNLSTIDIAYELGFSSSQHFSNAFKQYELLTPSQFRKLPAKQT